VLRPFVLHRPETLAEAAGLLSEHRGEVALYAGGTELLVLLKEGLLRVPRLIDVKRVAGLGLIHAEDGSVLIGATVQHRAVEHSVLLRATCPLVANAARHVANPRVRSVGTVGGNLAFADPHSDFATLFLALDASVRLWGPRGPRELPLADFIRGAYETAREEDEILTAVRLHPWPAGTVATYVKFGIHERPTLGVAVALTLDPGRRVLEARIAVGCVGPRPQRIAAAEGLAGGRPLAEVLADADTVAWTAAAAVAPVDDLHGSAEYKREMTRVFVRRALGVVGARAERQESHARYRRAVVV